MTRIVISPDFYLKHVGDRPVAGNTATIVGRLKNGLVIAEVDGLAPYMRNGRVALPAESYVEVSP